MKTNFITLIFLTSLFISCSGPDYDIIIRNGMIYDGSGTPPMVADVAINADTIAFVGDLNGKIGKKNLMQMAKPYHPVLLIC